LQSEAKMKHRVARRTRNYDCSRAQHRDVFTLGVAVVVVAQLTSTVWTHVSGAPPCQMKRRSYRYIRYIRVFANSILHTTQFLPHRAMLRRARLCHSHSSVRLSVRSWRSGMFFTQVGILRK